jgi:hypothetical protein
MLPGAKPSNKTGTAAIDLASGGVDVYGQEGDKFSAENRGAATQLAQSVGTMAGNLSKLLGGAAIGGRATVDIGNRDGIGARFISGAGADSGTWHFADNDNAAVSKFYVMKMLESVHSSLTEPLQKVISEIPKDTAEGIITALGRIASVTNGGAFSANQTIAARNIDFGNVDNAVAELTWVRDTYEALTSTTKAASAFDQSLAALNASWQDTINHAARLGLATDALSVSWADATTKAVTARNDAVDRSTGSLNVRLNRARGVNGEAMDLFEFDVQADDQRKAFATQLEAWGLSAEQTADRMALLEETLGAERLAISKSYADKIIEDAKQKTAQAAQAAGGIVTSLTEYARGLRTGDGSPLSAQAQYSGSSSEFNAVYGAAAAGDAGSIGKLSSYADALLKTSRTLFGSGAQYVVDYQRVVDAIGSVAAQSSDELTASFYASQVQEQTTTLNGSLIDLRTEVSALRREITLNGARPAA